MKPKRKASARSSHKAAALSFFLFGLIALAIVVTLEFLDHKAGRYSFIFSKVIPLEQKQAVAEHFQDDLVALQAGHRIPRDIFRDQAGVTHVKIDLAEPLYPPFSRDLKALVEKHGGIHLLSDVQGMRDQVVYLYQIRFSKRLTHVILLSKRLALKAPEEDILKVPSEGKKPSAPKAKPAKAPRLAIIIDDLGYADLISGQLRELGIPITAAVIPDSPFARSEAQRLHDFGLEAIIHLPMQPMDPANHHPRDQFVLIDSSAAEIQALLQNAMSIVPFAGGVNNHMGSLLTSDQQAMRRVLGLIKEQGLFFIDSKTTTSTVAHAVARALKVRTALRDVFLDDVQTYEHASAQIRRLVELARQNGRALAIGHPFPSTLAALRDSIPWLKQQRVEIVFASAILE
ncbi:MAG: divergent polysaccharide deacetylase family protein [Acidobacteriota bacterium]|nr:divergent polysaccharide deacetylase family protein [Acidobacteriota bacterium]